MSQTQGRLRWSLTPSWLKKGGALPFESRTGTYAGGKQAASQRGRMDSSWLFTPYAVTMDVTGMRFF